VVQKHTIFCTGRIIVETELKVLIEPQTYLELRIQKLWHIRLLTKMSPVKNGDRKKINLESRPTTHIREHWRELCFKTALEEYD
jgi:hypothetical protein